MMHELADFKFTVYLLSKLKLKWLNAPSQRRLSNSVNSQPIKGTCYPGIARRQHAEEADEVASCCCLAADTGRAKIYTSLLLHVFPTSPKHRCVNCKKESPTRSADLRFEYKIAAAK